MKTDIEIAQEVEIKDIREIAKKLNMGEDDIITYGKNKAKINHKLIEKLGYKEKAKVVLVTAVNPTPAGEGKTTTTIGLGDALNKLNKNPVICLREPSLGPVFGMKGGATGGGYSQVIPMEDINLHFTGDIHAIGAANNLLAAMIDNHIFQGNKLNINPITVTWKRAVDMNDRQLRYITNGLGGKINGIPREDGFDITVASEIMAIFCLSKNLDDLKKNISNIVIGYTYNDKPVYAKDLKAEGAVTALLKDAFNPNLVQTLEQTPTIIHGGPFANIAHGCNSVVATEIGRKLGDIVVTEAGFGADLGAEKFFDIKCQKSDIDCSGVVLVATIKALKYHGGCKKELLGKENLEFLEKGILNLNKHIDNIKNVFNLPVIVSINKFGTDTENEIKYCIDNCREKGVEVSLLETYAKGSDGGLDLAEKVINMIKDNNIKQKYTYSLDDTLQNKIETVASNIYGARSVSIPLKVKNSLKKYESMGYGNLPICIAKTPYSFSDDAKRLGIPQDFELSVTDVRLSAGAGFVVVLTGNVMTMPGLPKIPAAEGIDVDNDGKITGLF